MCVKEFYGYNCGHCSVPVLRQCPLSASDRHYPVCKFPAERPIFTNEFCHPCSRVVWNDKVLKEEGEHRAAHLRGECGCEIIFDGEDREKQCRTRGDKGKGKVRNKGNGIGEQYGSTNGVVDHGKFGQGTAEGEPGGDLWGGRDNEETWGLEDNMQMVKVEDASARGSWDPAAQMAAYEYVGYYVENGQGQGTDPEQSYAVALGGGGQGQLPMGEIGGGMRWCPNQQQQFYHAQQPQPIPYFDNGVKGTPQGSRAAFVRATSLPYGRFDCPGPVGHVEFRAVLSQPLVVSSDMIRSQST